MIAHLKELGDGAREFIERTRASDPSGHVDAELLLDTNVLVDLYTVADYCEALEASPPREAKIKFRRFRLKYSLLLAWWLANQGHRVGFLGAETVEQVTEKKAPRSNTRQYSLTRSWVLVIREVVFGGLRLGSLVDVDHEKMATQADDELLRRATVDRLPLVTWEGFKEDLTFSRKRTALRNRCRTARVDVCTPAEYLAFQQVDTSVAADSLITACKRATWTACWNRLPGHEHVDALVDIYSSVLESVP